MEELDKLRGMGGLREEGWKKFWDEGEDGGRWREEMSGRGGEEGKKWKEMRGMKRGGDGGKRRRGIKGERKGEKRGREQRKVKRGQEERSSAGQ